MTESTSKQPRKSKSEYVIKLWIHLQKRIDGIINEETSFEQLTKFMGDSKNIKLTASFITMLSSFCNKEPINKANLNIKNKQSIHMKKARLILSSLMIHKFPLDVLDVADIKDLDPSSEACYQSAIKMIDCIIKTPINDNNGSNNLGKLQCDDLLKCVNQFIDNFNLWKNKDLEKVLDSVINYYSQWMKSYKILNKSSMNEAQKKIILNTLVMNMNKTQTRIAKLVGIDKAKKICQEIKDKINSEPDHVPTPKNNQNTSNQQQNEEKKEEKEETLKEKLAKKGVPMNIKSGRNLMKENPKIKSEKIQNETDDENKYIKDVNGQKMLDLDMIIMEEASKKYWSDFTKEIENNNYSRLFELLSELLERLKKLSPEKEHKHLDDLMDVKFIQQTIENGMIDAKGFYAIFYGIWNQIKSIQAQNEDKEWQLWHDYIMKQFGSENENATWGTLLSQVFNVFLRKIDRIEDQIKVIKHVQNDKKK